MSDMEFPTQSVSDTSSANGSDRSHPQPAQEMLSRIHSVDSSASVEQSTPIQASALSQHLDRIASELRGQFEVVNRAREEALRTSREVIQLSSRAIRSIHRGEIQAAQNLIEQARTRLLMVKQELTHFPEIFCAGYVQDSQKEYVEAETMLAIVNGTHLPDPAQLCVEAAAYLNGMAEAASESRRYVLERLRIGDFTSAERVLHVMDEIYFQLVTFDFPDAITGGLRRTTDALRAVLERTRADLTLTLSQQRLESAIHQMMKLQTTPPTASVSTANFDTEKG